MQLSKPVKILTWNLNHRTIAKPIPDDALRVFIESDADLISLNEYVDDPSRHSFKETLAEAGLVHQHVSPSLGKNNQIFIASRLPLSEGDLNAPTFTDAAATNFLHVKIEGANMEFVGFRAPAYKLANERMAYWTEMGEIIRAAGRRNIVFAGDINYDPFLKTAPGAKVISFNDESDFSIPNPAGEWSFISMDGKRTSRINHTIVAGGLAVSGAAYLATFNGLNLAGPEMSRPSVTMLRWSS
jgi:hypothetical protein